MAVFNLDGDLEPLKQYEMIYLGSPYTKYPWGLDEATTDIARIVARLIRAGLKVYSPIIHTHYIALAGNIDPIDHEFWINFDTAMMLKSDSLLIAMMSGWDQSRGIKAEIDTFVHQQKPIDYLQVGVYR